MVWRRDEQCVTRAGMLHGIGQSLICTRHLLARSIKCAFARARKVNSFYKLGILAHPSLSLVRYFFRDSNGLSRFPLRSKRQKKIACVSGSSLDNAGNLPFPPPLTQPLRRNRFAATCLALNCPACHHDSAASSALPPHFRSFPTNQKGKEPPPRQLRPISPFPGPYLSHRFGGMF